MTRNRILNKKQDGIVKITVLINVSCKDKHRAEYQIPSPKFYFNFTFVLRTTNVSVNCSYNNFELISINNFQTRITCWNGLSTILLA